MNTKRNAPRIKYLFIDMKMSTYILMCSLIGLVFLAVAAVGFFSWRHSDHIVVQNIWWIALVGILVGLVEAGVAIRKAYKDRAKGEVPAEDRKKS